MNLNDPEFVCFFQITGCPELSETCEKRLNMKIHGWRWLPWEKWMRVIVIIFSRSVISGLDCQIVSIFQLTGVEGEGGTL